MYKVIVIFLLMAISNFSHSYTVVLTEYGEIIEIKDGLERRISIKALGGVYHVSKDFFIGKDVKDWVDVSKEDRIKKLNLTPLSNFSDIDPKPYFDDCYIYYQAHSEVHFRVSDSGNIILKRRSYSLGEVLENISSGKLKKFKNVVVLVDEKNEIILTSEVNEKSRELLVFSDPKFNEWELQYVVNDCSTGKRIYPIKGQST